jgi:peptidyl-prolyl cis-trans isomerase D
MLSYMREYAASWLIKFLLFAIVVVFVLWGVGSYRSERSNRIARVNTEYITMAAYRESYNNLMNQYRQQFGQSLNDEMIKMLQLKKQALDQLINQSLLEQEARRLDLRVTDQELAENIRAIAAFQNDGAFDSRLYQRILSSNRLSPEAFEAMQRQALLIGKLRSLVLESVKVSESELTAWYNWQEASVDIDYALIDPQKFKIDQVTAEDLKAYFEANQSRYKTPPKVKARYLRFTPQMFEQEVAISEDEIAAYYEENLEEFGTPKTVEARHILLKVDAEADAEAVAEAKKKADKVYQLAKSGEDFADLAKKYSEGPTKARGGQLGAFRKESMVKPFADKAFAMQAGEISEPVRTQFGWHIILVEKINEATSKTLEEAAPEIRKKLTERKGDELAYDKSLAVYDTIFEGEDLSRIAEEQKLEIHTTDFFDRTGPQKAPVQNRSQFASTAFDLPLNGVSEIQDLGDGYYIIQASEKKEPEVPKMEAVREKVRADFIKSKQDEMAQAEAQKLMAALKEGKPFAEASAAFDLKPGVTGFFKRTGDIPNLGNDRAISTAAFNLSKEKPLPEEAVKTGKGYYVIRFRERQLPDAKDFEKEKETISNTLLEQKRASLFRKWLAELKDRSEVEITEPSILE